MKSNETFDPTNPAYQCCCGCCHVSTGTKFICSLFLIWCFLIILPKIILFPHPIIIFVGIIMVIFAVFAFISTFYGLKVEKANWLFPLLAALVLATMMINIQYLYGLYLIFTDNRLNSIESRLSNSNQSNNRWLFHHGNQFHVILILYIIIKLITTTIFGCWLFSIVYRCYQYLITKNKDVKVSSQHQCV